MEARRRSREQGAILAAGLAVSALLHVLVLLFVRLTVPDPPDAGGGDPASTEADPPVQLVTLAPAVPAAPAARPPAVVATPREAAARAAAASAAPLPVPVVARLDATRLVAPPEGAAPASIPSFDLRPSAPVVAAAVPGAGAVEPADRGPGLLRRILGGVLRGASMALGIPCGPSGTPGDGTVAGVPTGGEGAVPGVVSVPGVPGVAGKPLPPRGGVIGAPAVPEPTVQIPRAPGADGAGATGGDEPPGGGLIECDDRSGRGLGGLGGGGRRPFPSVVAGG